MSDVLIVGAGLSGLCCARELTSKGVSCRVLEASDSVGGRVKTDHVDGFLLDRGFQVLLTAYPEARRVLDYSALQLRRFEPGALIRFAGGFRRFADPWRRPRHAVATAVSPVATLPDKLRVAGLRRRVSKWSMDEINERPETSTIQRLREDGFSEKIIERFFRPFLGGVFLEPELTTSSRKFEFVFRMFANGDAALPERGMQAIPDSIAEQLPDGCLRTNATVESVQANSVVLANGERLEAQAVVVATESPTAHRLLNREGTCESNEVACLYFSAPRPPVEEAILVLNGEGKGPINNLCVPSQVARTYAPEGAALVSVSVLKTDQDDEQLLADVSTQLQDWFGSQVQEWRHLRTYRIHHALPRQSKLNPVEQAVVRPDGVFQCGDYLDAASIQGAMATGRRAAMAVLERVGPQA